MANFPLTLISKNTKISFFENRFYAYFLSLALLFLTILGFFVKGLNLGVDFKGGIVIEALVPGPGSISDADLLLDDLRKKLESSGYQGVSIQQFSTSGINKGFSNIMLRVPPSSINTNMDLASDLRANVRNVDVLDALGELGERQEVEVKQKKQEEQKKQDGGEQERQGRGRANQDVSQEKEKGREIAVEMSSEYQKRRDIAYVESSTFGEKGGGHSVNMGKNNIGQTAVINSSSSEYVISDLKSILQNFFPQGIEFTKFEYVGPKVGSDFVRDSLLAVSASLFVMMLYTWIRFGWSYGMGVIIALMHDAILTMGFYIWTGYQFDLTSVAAILTIVGYSINDTVVIYDRVRYNLNKYLNRSFVEIINLSVNETLSRTVVTFATTLLVCLVLGLYGGEALSGLGFAISFGITVGTYSSVYIASSLLTLFVKSGKVKKI